MNNKTSGIGCGLLIILAVIFSIGQLLFTTSAGWLIIGLVTLFIVMGVRTSKASKQKQFLESIESSAQILDDIAAGKDIDLDGGFSLKPGEKLLYAMPLVCLTEYQSTGSTYSGSSGGVSFPLVGNLRGNVGMQGGQITKNPDQLMIVDQGRAIFTDKRIVFSGAKLVRDFEFDKIVDLNPGPNGYTVRIAVSNRERTSGLQATSPYVFGPGFIAGYAYTLFSDGAEKAKAWAADVTSRMRATVAEQRTKTKD